VTAVGTLEPEEEIRGSGLEFHGYTVLPMPGPLVRPSSSLPSTNANPTARQAADTGSSKGAPGM
jgi:hypothetical protein